MTKTNTWTLLFIFFLIGRFDAQAQDVTQTFNSTRIVNAHSAETLKDRQWEYRIEHRFGDFAGSNGGIYEAFGFDQAADIRMAFEHGITDKWMIGFGRSKGGYVTRSLLDAFVKGRLLTQNKEKRIPISLAIVGTTYASYMREISDPTSVANFDGTLSRRLAYATQLILTRKISDRISLALMPTFVHRNFVDFSDANSIFSLGGAANVKITKNIGVVVEYFQNFEPKDGRANFKNSLGVGFEFVTNGHNFHINLTNSRGFGEMQYVALTQEDWLKGEFRLGFSIARNFKLRRK